MSLRSRIVLLARLAAVAKAHYKDAEACPVCGHYRIPGEGQYHQECDNLIASGLKSGVNIFVRDRFRCRGCGAGPEADLTIDHIVSRHRHGAEDATNLQTLCRKCNIAKGAA